MKKQLKRNQKQNAKKQTLRQHARASLFSVAPHHHTGHRLTRHHTSHGALLLILALAGAVGFVGISAIHASADTKTINQDVTITATVTTDPPTVGAVITNIADKTRTTIQNQEVSGTCPTNTYVAIYNNAVSVGSVVCSNSGDFSLTIQLSEGTNVLQAQDYDINNQSGPVTSQLTIIYTPPDNTSAVQPAPYVDASIDTRLVGLPTTNPCYNDPADQTAPSGQLSLTVSCITHNVFVGEILHLPVFIHGGAAPYALSIDWGDETTPELKSFPLAGRYTIDHTFSTAKVRNLLLHVADSDDNSFSIQTVVQVSEVLGAENATTTSGLGAVVDAAKSSWLDATIPVYAGLVVLVGGFWVGDVFERATHIKQRITRRHA